MITLERIPCDHPIDWRWKSTPTDGAFCVPCQRVYPVLTYVPEPEPVLDLDDIKWLHTKLHADDCRQCVMVRALISEYERLTAE